VEYDKEYYTTGNYTDYLQRKFAVLAKDLIDLLKLEPFHKVIDFGCGYGGLIQELHDMGYSKVYGTDISNWAIEYGRGVFPDIADRLHYYNRNLLSGGKDYVLLLDVLEHMPVYEVEFVLKLAAADLSDSLLARVPVSANEGQKYVLEVSNNDLSHINCHCRKWWLDLFSESGYIFTGDITRPSIYSSEGVLAGTWELEI
jgi:predicted TPR repeat methyltransferase